jgi:hypothetical protein
VSELDEAWELALAEAAVRARAGGRGDIAEYLALRSRNDLLRRTAAEWLQTTLTTLAGEANRAGAAVSVEHQDAHRFRAGQAMMAGTLLTLRSGVRSLMLESGWPRTPRDGFVRGGGLACANIKHFGRRAANAEMMLICSPKGAPQWFILERTGTRSLCTEAQIRDHFAMLLG